MNRHTATKRGVEQLRVEIGKSKPKAPVVKTAEGRFVAFKKAEADLQIVWGEVYAPVLMPDSQNDFASAETIRDMCYGFMAKGDMYAIDTEHDKEANGCYVVECFVAREGDPDFIPGSWVMGVKIPDPELWGLVKSGEINGFSLDGVGIQVPTLVEVDVPELLTGMTGVNSEGDYTGVAHEHEFFVKFDENGNFLGGVTDVGPDGFAHQIKRGTVTETANGHNHRFSFIEGILSARIVEQADA